MADIGLIKAFKCDKCGLCCRSLRYFGELYSDLDDGSGCCRYFDKSTNLCSIYEQRPLKCRVDEGYKVYFSNISYEKYIDATIKGCQALKSHKESILNGKNKV